MFRIDVDAHVDESEATWDYLDNGTQRFKPVTLDPGAPTAPGDARPHRLWVIDGNIRLRRWRDDKRTGTVKATRELLDVDARLRHMDELRVDVQVLYPTLFLHALTDRPEIELALCKSYNRWIAATEKVAGACAGSPCCRCSLSTAPPRKCAGRRIMALAAYSRRASMRRSRRQ